MPATELPAKKLSSGHADYGLDAPGVVRSFFWIGGFGLLLGCGLFISSSKGVFPAGRFIAWSVLPIGIIFSVQGVVMIWGSRVGKLRLRDKLIASLAWRGDERVLDVGCGHGLMLIGAARRLSSGKAVGIDLWQNEDQAGNSRDATMRNAIAENVADRIELVDGDARKLPFASDSFDVVLSSWALHNIYDTAGRATAIREIARVLKPGCHLLLVDIRHAHEYARVLRECGIAAALEGPNFLFVIPSFTVRASKPVKA